MWTVSDFLSWFDAKRKELLELSVQENVVSGDEVTGEEGGLGEEEVVAGEEKAVAGEEKAVAGEEVVANKKNPAARLLRRKMSKGAKANDDEKEDA